MTKQRNLLMAVVMAALLGFAALAVAQGEGPGGQGGPGGPMGQGGPGRGPMGPPPVAITATAQGVYVVTGPYIVRYDAATLKELARAEMPRPEPRERPQPPAGDNQ